MSENILEIRNLVVKFPLYIGTIYAVNNVDLNIKRGSITALVGESGCGKSTIASSLLKMVSNPGVIDRNSHIYFNGKDVLQMSDKEILQYRWASVSMVFQAAQSCLNPAYTIGDQIVETYREHGDKRSEEVLREEGKKYLSYVRLDGDRILNSYTLNTAVRCRSFSRTHMLR